MTEIPNSGTSAKLSNAVSMNGSSSSCAHNTRIQPSSGNIALFRLSTLNCSITLAVSRRRLDIRLNKRASR